MTAGTSSSVPTGKLTADPADNHAGRPAVYVLDRGPADANGDFTGAPVMHSSAKPRLRQRAIPTSRVTARR